MEDDFKINIIEDVRSGLKNILWSILPSVCSTKEGIQRSVRVEEADKKTAEFYYKSSMETERSDLD